MKYISRKRNTYRKSSKSCFNQERNPLRPISAAKGHLLQKQEEEGLAWVCLVKKKVYRSGFALLAQQLLLLLLAFLAFFTELVNVVTIMNDDTFFNMLHW